MILFPRLGVIGYPTILAIKTNAIVPYDYSIPISRESLVSFTNVNCDKQRQSNGHLQKQVGVDPLMTPTVEAFMTTPDLRPELLAKAKGTYAQIMQMIIHFGETHFRQEIRRLQILLKSSWPPRSLQDQNQNLLNVLTQFEPFLV